MASDYSWVLSLAKIGLLGAGVYVTYKVGEKVVPKIVDGIDNLFSSKPKPAPPTHAIESQPNFAPTSYYTPRAEIGYDSTDFVDTSSPPVSSSTPSYDAPIESRKDVSGLTDSFKRKLWPVLETIAQQTGNFNRQHGTDYRWIIYSTTGGKHIENSYHYKGMAVDLVLMNGSKQVPIWDYSKWKGDKAIWELLDMVRCAVKRAGINWGGHWLSPFDPQHLEDRPYQSDKEWRWLQKRPVGAVSLCDPGMSYV